MRANLREIELCYYAFREEVKNKQKSTAMTGLISELEILIHMLITQAELEGDLTCTKN